jgi:hypothetical protein
MVGILANPLLKSSDWFENVRRSNGKEFFISMERGLSIEIDTFAYVRFSLLLQFIENNNKISLILSFI